MELGNNSNVTILPLKASDEAVDENRRGFVKKLTLTTLVLGIGGSVLQLGRFFKPNVLYEPSRTFKVGELNKFPFGSRTVIEGRGIEIVREKDGVHAVSLVCTHLGCLLKPVLNDSEVGYACPCHGSTFALKGEVLGGPAPKDLPWYEVYMDNTGTLVVDTSKVNQKRTKLVV
ncbi:menaquinol oxidoreductase complex, iron-sulfur cluster-binding subunit [Geotalea daltonii FRC-32]|uniref:Menaquinol oxidoreductase complex, iron-sulfur cluster-binding subunit n=1 Tax=Geotalea daltonii (strain DSM 22248 / JCM 15807 / FRC-32) TaxID=316067 RepID=B9M8G2_GEODF|nr:Rieske 2Fe-2S domain-containing protein [Geotalea daltonii]ACM18497.1 menaquinol oxidoreductase complex, iron-sulfur cluster-binding subunit [Geotalea daltonii FRC-32]